MGCEAELREHGGSVRVVGASRGVNQLRVIAADRAREGAVDGLGAQAVHQLRDGPRIASEGGPPDCVDRRDRVAGADASPRAPAVDVSGGDERVREARRALHLGVVLPEIDAALERVCEVIGRLGHPGADVTARDEDGRSGAQDAGVERGLGLAVVGGVHADART